MLVVGERFDVRVRLEPAPQRVHSEHLLPFLALLLVAASWERMLLALADLLFRHRLKPNHSGHVLIEQQMRRARRARLDSQHPHTVLAVNTFKSI